MKMDFNAPDKFIEFKLGWYRGVDFDLEAASLLESFDDAEKENDIQKYIKENKKWFIPASLFEDYDFGHHEAYIVPEQGLGAEYRVDYMLLGRNSIGYNIVLVEFEDVNVDYKIQSANTESESVRKGLGQIRDWKRWIDRMDCNANQMRRQSEHESLGLHIVSYDRLVDNVKRLHNGF